MNNSKINIRYAKALFQTAVDEDILEDTHHDVIVIRDFLRTPDIEGILSSPVIKTSTKKEVFREMLSTKIHDLTNNFLSIVLNNGREDYLEGIIRHFIHLYKDHKGTKTAHLTVALDIEDRHRQKFIDILESSFHSKIELEEKIAPGIIGGFILRVEDQQFDASVASSLSKLKKNLLTNSNLN